jgi:hypothetical protein
MIRKSMPSGIDPIGGIRFSEKIMLKQKSLSCYARRDDGRRGCAMIFTAGLLDR